MDPDRRAYLQAEITRRRKEDQLSWAIYTDEEMIAEIEKEEKLAEETKQAKAEESAQELPEPVASNDNAAVLNNAPAENVDRSEGKAVFWIEHAASVLAAALLIFACCKLADSTADAILSAFVYIIGGVFAIALGSMIFDDFPSSTPYGEARIFLGRSLRVAIFLIYLTGLGIVITANNAAVKRLETVAQAAADQPPTKFQELSQYDGLGISKFYDDKQVIVLIDGNKIYGKFIHLDGEVYNAVKKLGRSQIDFLEISRYLKAVEDAKKILK